MEEKNMEDITLKELIGILNKHKLLFTGVIIASVFLSTIYSFFIAVPIYQAKAEVEINRVNTGVSIIDGNYNSNITIDTLLKKMKELQYTEQVSKALKSKNIHNNDSDLVAIITSGKGVNERTIILSAKHKEKKEAAHIVNASVEALLELSDRYIREEIQKQLAVTERRIELGRKNIEKALQDYEESTAGLGGNDKRKSEIRISEFLPTQLIDESLIDKLYDNDLIPSIEVYKSLKMERIRLKLAEAHINTYPSAHILSNAVEPESAIWPNTKLIVSVSLIVGIGIASLSALAIEYFKNGK